MNKGMVSMFIMMMGGRLIDLSNPAILQLVRSIYILVGVLYWQTYSGLEEKIAKDETPIWLPVEQAKGIVDMLVGSPQGPPKEYKKTTMYEHELELAKKKSGAAFMSALQPFLMAQFMGFNIMLLMNVVMKPWEMLEDPLITKYVLGWATERPYGELYHDPAARRATGTAVQDGAGASGDAAASGEGAADRDASGRDSTGRDASGRDSDFEEAIFRTWESPDPVEIGIFEQLLVNGGKDPNYATVDQGWTALQVVCGSPQNGRREVIRLLELGCKPEPADKEGWTAMHWAAYHGNATGVRTLCAAYGLELPSSASDADAGHKGPKTKVPTVGTAEDLRSLLKTQDCKGRTPVAVAEEGGQTDDAGGAAVKSACKSAATLLQTALQQATAACKASSS